jgi:hypothetical protein
MYSAAIIIFGTIDRKIRWYHMVCLFVLLETPLTQSLRDQIFNYRRIWIVGDDPAGDMNRLLPGSKIIDPNRAVFFDSVLRIK